MQPSLFAAFYGNTKFRWAREIKRYQAGSHWPLIPSIVAEAISKRAFRELNRGRLSISFSRRCFFVLPLTDIARPRLSNANMRDTKIIAACQINSIPVYDDGDAGNNKKGKRYIESLNQARAGYWILHYDYYRNLERFNVNWSLKHNIDRFDNLS